MTRNIVLYGHYQQTLFCCPSLEMLEGQLFFAGAITIVGVKYLCFSSPKLKYTVRYSDTFCQSAVCLFTRRSFCKILILIISTHLSYWYFFLPCFTKLILMIIFLTDLNQNLCKLYCSDGADCKESSGLNDKEARTYSTSYFLSQGHSEFPLVISLVWAT